MVGKQLTHKKFFDKYKRFYIPLFEEKPYFKPLQFSNGLLSEGSKNLMKYYAVDSKCLKPKAILGDGLGLSVAGLYR